MRRSHGTRSGRWAMMVAFTACCLSSAGCDFFKELEGNESETGDESGEESGTESETGDGASCQLGLDDYCASQDILETCDPETGEAVTYDCAAACAPNLNVSCLSVGVGRACWCAAPGSNKIDTCSQLETCLDECGANAYEACGETCFSRTDATTLRLFGALLACAESSCREVCDADSPSCAGCLYQARAGLIGDCALERSICDQDMSDEPWP